MCKELIANSFAARACQATAMVHHRDHERGLRAATSLDQTCNTVHLPMGLLPVSRFLAAKREPRRNASNISALFVNARFDEKGAAITDRRA